MSASTYIAQPPSAETTQHNFKSISGVKKRGKLPTDRHDLTISTTTQEGFPSSLASPISSSRSTNNGGLGFLSSKAGGASGFRSRQGDSVFTNQAVDLSPFVGLKDSVDL